MNAKIFFLYLLFFVLTFTLTGLIYRYATNMQLMDMPNERSAHKLPTPRGGGLAFVVVFFLGLFIINALLKTNGMRLFSSTLMMGVVCSSMGVALLGFIDDMRRVSVGGRLLGHFLAAAIMVNGFADRFDLVTQPPLHFMALLLFMLLSIVALLNIFNFMDGIDALAASETIFVCCAMGIIHYLQGRIDVTYLSLLLAVCVAGFLCWNLPPAKIFMGDVGSGFLGVVIAGFAWKGAFINPVYFACWMILLGVFIVDASVTLLRRLFRGERIWKAHSQHAYQHATRLFHSHGKVTIAILCINIFWLFPWALYVSQGKVSAWVGIVSSYVPLILLALYFRAGKIFNP